ncbi:hypothetical protein ACQKKX_02690 [Neorhizobium sp. NPDC001467]|uniref:hypothetical protein n=1 Tax=Neorhizobium sp. NPDC001467 TaxID=3390595 RepID=UPI003D071814
MSRTAVADGFKRETAYNHKPSILSLIITVLFVMFPRLPMRWLPPVPQPAADTPPQRNSGHDDAPRIAAE